MELCVCSKFFSATSKIGPGGKVWSRIALDAVSGIMQKVAVGCGLVMVLAQRQLLAAALACLPVVLFPQIVTAGSITLQTLGKIRVGAAVGVTLKVTNSGDEAAHELKPDFEMGMNRGSGELLESLEPGSSHEWELSLGDPPAKAGRYAVRCLVNYRDANGYPFSALLMLVAVVGEAEPGEVVASVEPARLRPGGEMVVNLTNRGREARALSLFLDTPREILVEAAGLKLLLGPGESRKIRMPLRSAGGLAGSSYAVFARVEYETAEKHFTEFFPAVAKVEASRAAPYRSWLLAAAILLAAVAIGLQIKRGRRRSAA